MPEEVNHKKDGGPKSLKQEQIPTNEALKLFRNALNLNVISRYDSAMTQILYNTTYCVVYKFNEDDGEWIKTDYSGMLALYLRNYKVPSDSPATYQDLQNLFCYGLILMNRNNPECFSIGLLPNNFIKHFFPNGIKGLSIMEMDVELNDNLIIVKNILGEIYGLWVFDEEDRRKLYKSLNYCLNNDPSSLA